MHEYERGDLKAGGSESASQYLPRRIQHKPIKNDFNNNNWKKKKIQVCSTHSVSIDAYGALWHGA